MLGYEIFSYVNVPTIARQEKLQNSLKYRLADKKAQRIMMEKFWAEINEIAWEKIVKKQKKEIARQKKIFKDLTAKNKELVELQKKLNQNTILSNQVAELQRKLQQAGIDIPSA